VVCFSRTGVIPLSVQQSAYVVLRKAGTVEVRRYEPQVLAVSRESDLRGYSGFNVLFDYISGGNRDARKISMTSPVLNNLDDKPLTTAFVMPPGMTLAALPQPNASGPDLMEVPERVVAALLFSGNIGTDLLARKKTELLDWIREQGLSAEGPVELARYNPPFLPGFLKRNELLVPVHDPGETGPA
jgi:hypothetical protein